MMSNEQHEISPENVIPITPEKMAQIKVCVDANRWDKNLKGILIGMGVTSLPLALVRSKLTVNKAATLALIGAVYGFFISSYLNVRDCVNQIGIDPNAYTNNSSSTENIYKNRKNKSEDEEVATTEIFTKKSIFDVDSPPQMNLFDELPVNNESADVQDNKEPERTVTYEHLRQKNRDNYKPVMFLPNLRNRERRKEPNVKSTKELETESDESGFFPQQGTGKSKTKYGDVWD